MSPKKKPRGQRSRREFAAWMAFARALDEAIDRKEMTGAEFGMLVGLDDSSVSHYRSTGTSRRQVKIGRALLLAKAAGFSLDALVAEAGWDGQERHSNGGGPSEGGDEPRRPGPVDPNDPHGVGPQRSPSRSSRRAGDSG